MGKIALSFCAPTLNDVKSVRETVFHVEQSDLAFPNIYLLREKYGTTITIHDGCLYRHFSGTGRLQGYAFPVGHISDLSEALFHVEQHAQAHGNELKFCLLTEENARQLQAHYGDEIHFTDDPGDADYLYSRTELAELPGTAFHKKRNHIARFEKRFPEWKFEKLTAENSEDALTIATAWAEAQGNSPALLHELRAIKNALEHTQELGIIGGLIYCGQRAIAMSLASYITPLVADIHYEKCLPEYRDAYPLICREMARMLPAELLNREEDLNIPGLRQAKLSWKPTRILHKLSAVIKPC